MVFTKQKLMHRDTVKSKQHIWAAIAVSINSPFTRYFELPNTGHSMFRASQLRPLFALIVLSLSLTTYAQAQSYFRITNESGAVELKSTITPQEAKRGYAIVTLGGHVIEEVAPELSDEEYALVSDEVKQKKRAEEMAKEEQRYNESLLLRYSTVEDIEAEQKRKLAAFDVRISILRSNMLSLKSQVERQQERAANIERGGREVPDIIKNNINELEDKLKNAETSVTSRKEEKAVVIEQYVKEKDRFRKLIGLLPSRQN